MDDKRLDVEKIIDLENRVDVLEGNEPDNKQPITKPQLDDLNDRINVLEGNEPEGPKNPMFIDELKGFEGRVEELEG